MNQTLRSAHLAFSLLAVLFLAAPSGTLADPDPAVPRPPTRKELERKIKDAEKRAKRLSNEARDDERRANSWNRRADEAEAIGRSELAKQNRKIAEGFASDAAKERQQAGDALKEAADARQMLMELASGQQPSSPAPPGPDAPGPPKAAPDQPDVSGTTEPPSAPSVPKADEPPKVGTTPGGGAAPVTTPGSPGVPGAPGSPGAPARDCGIKDGSAGPVQTRVVTDGDKPDHPLCLKFADRTKQVVLVNFRPDGYELVFEDLPITLRCHTGGSCDAKCTGVIPAIGSHRDVPVEIDPIRFDPLTGKYGGHLVIRFPYPGGPLDIEFEGVRPLGPAATAYPLVAVLGLALIALGAALRTRRFETSVRAR